VKKALSSLDWGALKAHLESIDISINELSDLRGHIRRFSNFICKHPRRDFQQRRDSFWENLRQFIEERFGISAASEVENEFDLIKQIERGYHSILFSLAKCSIGKKEASIRVSSTIKRACLEYKDLLHRTDKTLSEKKQLNLLSGILLQDENGNKFSSDAVLEGLSTTVAITLIMEAFKNNWFENEIIVLPELPEATEEDCFQAGATQIHALIWLHWQRMEKQRRFLGGDFCTLKGEKIPPSFPKRIDELIEYHPPDGGLSEQEVYDYLANTRLKDRLIQTYTEMEMKCGLSKRGSGICGSPDLPPKDFVSGEEAHACVSLSETLGYSLVDDNARPGGLRLLEWVRGYAVLKEIASVQASSEKVSSNAFSILLSKTKLVGILQNCGLKGDLASRFIEVTCLRKLSHDLFDYPLIRVGASDYLLFGPAVIHTNFALVVLSNLASRGENLGRKEKAFEKSMQKFFHKQGMQVFSFKVHRNNQEYEFDAVLPWEGYMFVFECKNHSLSGREPEQVFYFDQETKSQAKQVKRLAWISTPEKSHNIFPRDYFCRRDNFRFPHQGTSTSFSKTPAELRIGL